MRSYRTVLFKNVKSCFTVCVFSHSLFLLAGVFVFGNNISRDQFLKRII